MRPVNRFGVQMVAAVAGAPRPRSRWCRRRRLPWRRAAAAAGAELELDALLAGRGDLAAAGRHGVGLVLGRRRSPRGAQAEGGTGGVDGGDAVADDQPPCR